MSALGFTIAGCVLGFVAGFLVARVPIGYGREMRRRRAQRKYIN